MNDLDDLDDKLYNYVRNERIIYSVDTFNKLRARYPNTEKLTVYRGINFKTEDDYDEFMETFNQTKKFKSDCLSGFSNSYETAQDFSETTKTYFPGALTIAEEEVRTLTAESMAGFIGIIIKVIVEPNSVVDINSSQFGIEDEVLLSPDIYYDCEIETVLPLKNRIKNININDHIQNSINKQDNIFHYIIKNHVDDLSLQSKTTILNSVIFKKEDKNIFDTEDHSNMSLIESHDNLIIYNRSELNYRTNDGDINNVTHMIVPSFYKFSLYGIFNDVTLHNQITKISNQVMYHVLNHYINNKTDSFNFESLKTITPYLNDNMKDLYKRMICEKNGSYNTLQSTAIKGINNDKISHDERNILVEKYKKDLLNLFKNIDNELPLNMSDLENMQLKTKERKSKAISRLNKLL